MKWHELPRHRKLDLWRIKFDEFLKGLTPYERDCIWKVNFQGADRESVDPHAKQVVEEAVNRFNERWRSERESQEYGTTTDGLLNIVVRF